MKIFVKTLKGTNFEIEVKPENTVAEVKQIIETAQGADVYPAPLQNLIHKGKVLKDETTLEENKVAENSFVVVMLSKKNVIPSPAVSLSPSNTVQPASSQPVTASTEPASTVSRTPPAPVTAPLSDSATAASVPSSVNSNVYNNAASNLVAGSNLESTIQQILDMGGGSWDRDTVVRALRAAYNNPERAIDYLYSGIPEQAVVPPVARAPVVGAAVNPPIARAPVGGAAVTPPPAPAPQPPVPSTGPNTNPLNLFPQGLPNMGSNAGAGNLDFLRNNEQFQALRAVVQANPQILQPLLRELAKQNPNLMRLIQENQGDFINLINEPVEGVEGGEGNLGQLGGAVPQAVHVTPEERDAIERLEAMGFDRPTVLQVYFACNKNEELAANYLLDHMHDFNE